MEYVSVIVAAVAAFAFGAVWYTTMSKPWMAAAGIPMDAAGKPQSGGGAAPMVIGFVAELVVAGMMRHVFVMAHLDTLLEGLMGGFGIGAFLITPWVTMNYAFSARPFKLALLDGVNAVVGCTVMGIVLVLF